jgi:hypothetical protein
LSQGEHGDQHGGASGRRGGEQSQEQEQGSWPGTRDDCLSDHLDLKLVRVRRNGRPVGHDSGERVTHVELVIWFFQGEDNGMSDSILDLKFADDFVGQAELDEDIASDLNFAGAGVGGESERKRKKELLPIRPRDGGEISDWPAERLRVAQTGFPTFQIHKEMLAKIGMDDWAARLALIPADGAVVVGIEGGTQAQQGEDIGGIFCADLRLPDPDGEVARVRLVGLRGTDADSGKNEAEKSIHR